MVSRIYVEKKPGFDGEAKSLERELKTLLEIDGITNLRIINRYDVEGIDDALFEQCVPTVFSEPQTDAATREMPAVAAGIRHAEGLSRALDARCYEGGAGRTHLHEQHVGPRDLLAVVAVAALIAALFLLG